MDQRPGGAGGATGIGRGFAFARKNQIAKVINEVASKGGRAPRQVVITHSLAGGSGSGMVLPVLQFVRGLFPPDTIIWVMSVGIGASERRPSRKYNTPFIISDILQSTYDGIHIPIRPIDELEWLSYSKRIEQSYANLVETSENLCKRLKIKSVRELNEINFTKTINDIGRDLQKIRTTDSEICPKKNEITLVGGATKLVGYKEQLPEINSPEGTDLFNIDDLLNLFLMVLMKLHLFQKWCWHKEYTGARPALSFWNTLSNSILDPLSYVYEGRAKISESKSTESLEYSDDFAPNFTYDDLTLVSKSVRISLENLDRKRNNAKLETTPSRTWLIIAPKRKDSRINKEY